MNLKLGVNPEIVIQVLTNKLSKSEKENAYLTARVLELEKEVEMNVEQSVSEKAETPKKGDRSKQRSVESI
jgi:hypothetical protein